MVEPSRRVLVVDDEDEVRESTCLLLESLGCQAIPLDDPGDVLPVAMEQQPGLILQDLKMPGMNLAGVVAALRSEPSTQHIPIVFFSANADIADTARRYDAWGFLRKPFSPQALAQVVAAVFGAPAAVDDANRRVRDAFHEQWNILSAVANYAHMMRLHAPDKGTQVVGQKLEGQLLRLEASLDRLHTLVSQEIAGGSAPRQAVSPGDLRPPRPGRDGKGHSSAARDQAASARQD